MTWPTEDPGDQQFCLALWKQTKWVQRAVLRLFFADQDSLSGILATRCSSPVDWMSLCPGQ